jgi:putative addiction module component (TIGR02574 family)
MEADMSNYELALTVAQKLPADERLRLIDALQETVEDSELPAEWQGEIERRVAEYQAGTAEMIPWSQIRAEALARIGHAQH